MLGVAGIDGQAVKATQVADHRGYDGGKEVTARKRHIVVDKLWLPPSYRNGLPESFSVGTRPGWHSQPAVELRA